LFVTRCPFATHSDFCIKPLLNIHNASTLQALATATAKKFFIDNTAVISSAKLSLLAVCGLSERSSTIL
jgi:hypothetical protein